MRQELEDYVRSLDLDAYLVGGAVRDELLGINSKDADFLVPGLDTEGLKRVLERLRVRTNGALRTPTSVRGGLQEPQRMHGRA